MSDWVVVAIAAIFIIVGKLDYINIKFFRKERGEPKDSKQIESTRSEKQLED